MKAINKINNKHKSISTFAKSKVMKDKHYKNIMI
jgi:hypothetical protein